MSTEIFDIYDESGNKTGAVIERENCDMLQPGQYHLVVHIFIRNSKDQWFLQRRSLTKSFMPGEWDVTAGAVSSGEDALTAALRETREEIGIDLDPAYMRRICQLKREHKHCLIDIWLAEADFKLGDCVLQPEEVCEIKWVSRAEMLRLTYEQIHHGDEDYCEVVEDMASMDFLNEI